MLRLRRGVPLEHLFLATYGLFAFHRGALAIADNSAFVHLRTGRIIADGGGIPRSDPYSFTARGTRWVVQSWLPEWTYGLAWRFGGLHLVVLEQAVLAGLIAVVTASLARAGTPARTAASAGLVVCIGIPFWSPRPLLFGLLGFALLVLVVERRHSPLWLFPILWVWVSSHGSFPLGILWLAAVSTGLALDERSLRSSWRQMGRYLVAAGTGLVLSALNPLGPRLLSFAVTVGEKREIFERMLEWRSPDFQDFAPAFSLVFIILALAILLRSRPPFRDVLPVLGFTVLGLIAVRNLPLLSITLAPALSRSLRSAEPAAPEDEARAPIAFAAAFAGAAVLLAVTIWQRPALDLERYPIAAVDHLEERGLLGTARIAHQDTTGGYLVLREGLGANVFVDDRVDMYPVAVTRDYGTLLRGQADTLDVLDRRDVEVVLWKTDLPLATMLDALPGWQRTYREDGWVIYQRR